MDIQVSPLRGGGIIWAGENLVAYRKRGSMVIRSVERDKSSWGFVGSDRLDEDNYGGFRETIEPVMNNQGQFLRFGLIACNALRARSKLKSGDRLRVVSSYPLTAFRQLGDEDIEYVPGCVEAELVDRSDEIDVGFELIQSGDTIRGNGLEIVEDNIATVKLECIRTPYDW